MRVFSLLFLTFLLLLPARAETDVLGLRFEAGVPMGAPQELGVDAFSVQTPDQSLEVVVHAVPGAIVDQMRASGADPYANEKAVYLGLSSPAASTVKRQVLGQESVGEVYPKVLGKFAVECHWVPLPDGRRLLLAFRRPLATPPEALDSLAASVCQSLR